MNTTGVYDAAFMRNLGIIAEDEQLAARLRRYVQRLVKPKRDDAQMTEEEFFARVDHSLQQAREGRVTRIETKEELTRFLEDL